MVLSICHFTSWHLIYFLLYIIYQVSLKTSGGNKSGYNVKNFDNSLVDLLFVLTEAGICYSIPTTNITSKTTLNLGDNVSEFIVSLGVD